MPDAIINVALSPAPNNSDVRRPSKKLNTNPQIMPRGKPLKNMAIGFNG